MPAYSRRQLADPSAIETHHVWSRCVGRAWLMGPDPQTGEDFSHRRHWVESLHEYYAGVFAIDQANYSILSNHLHGIHRTRPDIAATWSDEEVCWRWKRAWPAFVDGVWQCTPTDEAIRRMLQHGQLDPAYLPKLRLNLSNLSWLMARIKQPIAWMANREKDRRGHHWEQRFGNRRLDTDEEVVVAFLYNDLQQSEAGMVDSVEHSQYAAIQRQIRAEAACAYFAMYGETCPPEREHELEQLEAMFANCFLAPISSDSPLMTPKPEAPAPQELVYPNEPQTPSGYVVNTRAACEQADAFPKDYTSSGPKGKKAPRAKSRRPQRRRRPAPPSEIDQRLKAGLRHRPSNSAVLNMPWVQYFQLLKQAEQKIITLRRGGPPHSNPPGATADDATPSTWRSQVREFACRMQSIAKELPKELARHLLPAPRGDPGA